MFAGLGRGNRRLFFVSGCLLHTSGIHRVSGHCGLFFFLGIEDGSDWGYYGVMAMPAGLHQNFIPHTTAAAGSTGLRDKVYGHA